MATLVLSTVGTALAGPIGGLLGSLVGQSIDQQLLGGGPRKGPRLGDLNVQTSSYGTPIPRIYGRMRVAGTIVWATDIEEQSELQGDGKSQPETVVYTYSASFAVALSCRRAARVTRIWADGKLIRGAAEDMKVAGKFRFYPGSEGQPVDPLIGSFEGITSCPAYRGLALAIFEDLQLASFGNRIPALTFELVSDDGEGIGIGELLADASAGAIQCDDERTIVGYAAHGQDIGSALAPLVEAFAVELIDEGDALRSPQAGTEVLPSADELGAHHETGGSPILQREQAAAADLPTSLTLSFYDPARDYQAGQARAAAPGPGRATRSLAVPCVLETGIAKTAAENLLLRSWALRERLLVRLPPRFLGLQPGTNVRLPGVAGDWVAEQVEIDRFVVAATLRPAWAYAGTRTADPGRSNPQPDIVAEATRLALFDLTDPETSQPVLALAAASPSGGWKPVPLEITTSGETYASRSATGEAVLGRTLSALGAGQPWLFDLASAVDIELANPDHWLQSRDELALANGANLAAIGDELIQFGGAEAIAPARFRLTRLLRGRRGSEWAIMDHAPGADFCLLDPRTIKPIALPVEMLGAEVAVTAHGPGDVASPPSVSRAANGEAMRPLSPAHLRAAPGGDGSLAISWVRRSRLAWAWTDEMESPADPSLQGYRLHVAGASGAIERDSSETQATLTAAEVAALGAGPFAISVRQIGALALSRARSIILN